MANLSFPLSSVDPVLRQLGTSIAPSAHSATASNLPVLLGVLRQAIAEAPSSAEPILAAVADSARVITGADGTAVASRMDGVIVCRARSGEIAPALGSPVSSDSGISGACVKSGATLVCNDVFTDTRVDTEVCLSLGIRSIAVLPLHGSEGVIGILEAFSSRPSAFGTEQVDSLQALAQIAEEAYEAETNPVESAVPPSATASVGNAFTIGSIPQLLRNKARTADLMPLMKRYWIVGAGGLALLLVLLVVGLSWRQTGAEISSNESTAQPARLAQPTPVASTPLEKPNGGIPAREVHVGTISSPLKNAAEIAPTTSAANSREAVKTQPARNTVTKNVAEKAPSNEVEAPPSIELANAGIPQQLVPAEAQPMPQFGAAVSQGLVEAALVRKVSPTYPQQARVQRIAGSVVLDATIAANGSVHKVKVISGPPILASAASDALREWRYTPALLNGKAIESQQRVTVVFTLP